MKSVVINLYGGPGVGKSTLSADTFAKLKLSQKSCELAGEYVKSWVYNKQSINEWDQIYILGKQIRRESLLYNKIEYIIADSPIMLVPFYESFLFKHEIVKPAGINFMKYAEQQGVVYKNFWLDRPDVPFQEIGRNQNHKEALIVDEAMKEWLKREGIDLIYLPKDHEQRMNILFTSLSLKPPY